tara:strand:+ start:5978 stop:6559 length:582 start_codon:yes stop_codon:yes gene_type:complete
MHIDYSKSKSYQRIVSKAKRYSPKGEDSLRANRERMQKKRSIFKTMMAANIIKDTREGAKELKELQENTPEEITKKFRTYNPQQQKVIKDVARATIKFPKSLLIDSVLKASGNGQTYKPPPISQIKDDQRGLYDIAKDTYNRVDNLRKQYGISGNLLTGEISKSGQVKGFNYRVDTDLFGNDKKVGITFKKDF